MPYLAWESAEGQAIDQVATFCRHLIKNGNSFSDEGVPPLNEVELFISNNYAKMVGMLARYGISAAQTNVSIVGILQSYLVYATVADVEATQPSNSPTRTSNTRFNYFKKKFDEFDNFIRDGNLTGISGVVLLPSSGYPDFTGSSNARKSILAADTDRVQPDITRKMMNSPQVLAATNDEL